MAGIPKFEESIHLYSGRGGGSAVQSLLMHELLYHGSIRSCRDDDDDAKKLGAKVEHASDIRRREQNYSKLGIHITVTILEGGEFV